MGFLVRSFELIRHLRSNQLITYGYISTDNDNVPVIPVSSDTYLELRSAKIATFTLGSNAVHS